MRLRLIFFFLGSLGVHAFAADTHEVGALKLGVAASGPANSSIGANISDNSDIGFTAGYSSFIDRSAFMKLGFVLDVLYHPKQAFTRDATVTLDEIMLPAQLYFAMNRLALTGGAFPAYAVGRHCVGTVCAKRSELGAVLGVSFDFVEFRYYHGLTNLMAKESGESVYSRAFEVSIRIPLSSMSK